MAGFPYIAGWGVFDRARLYISRGVGMGMFPLRFRCRPEIAVMTLRRGGGPPRGALG
jgi:predicted MPP superfamily phosphohydrolase